MRLAQAVMSLAIGSAITLGGAIAFPPTVPGTASAEWNGMHFNPTADINESLIDRPTQFPHRFE